MDRPATPGYVYRRPAAQLNDTGGRPLDDRRLRVGLQRTVELGAIRLALRDWPGAGGPLIHLPDPLRADDRIVSRLAEACCPTLRVMHLRPRGGAPYQVDVLDVLAFLNQFGFERPIVFGEGLGCLTALLVAVWSPDRVSHLVLLDQVARLDPAALAALAPGGHDTLAAGALRDCPPDVAALRRRLSCPVLDLTSNPPHSPAQIAHALERHPPAQRSRRAATERPRDQQPRQPAADAPRASPAEPWLDTARLKAFLGLA